MKNFITKRVVKDCNRLPREVVQTPSLEAFRRCVYVAFRFGGGLGSVRLMVGLGDIKGLFQPK